MTLTAEKLKRKSRPRSTSLDVFFHPKSVALIGASERAGSVGRVVLENLRATQPAFQIHAVNPNRSSILGRPAYPNVASIPGGADLAVLTTPAGSIPGLIRECAEAGEKREPVTARWLIV